MIIYDLRLSFVDFLAVEYVNILKTDIKCSMFDVHYSMKIVSLHPRYIMVTYTHEDSTVGIHRLR